jgi:hypothetical protein
VPASAPIDVVFAADVTFTSIVGGVGAQLELVVQDPSQPQGGIAFNMVPVQSWYTRPAGFPVGGAWAAAGARGGGVAARGGAGQTRGPVGRRWAVSTGQGRVCPRQPWVRLSLPPAADRTRQRLPSKRLAALNTSQQFTGTAGTMINSAVTLQLTGCGANDAAVALGNFAPRFRPRGEGTRLPETFAGDLPTVGKNPRFLPRPLPPYPNALLAIQQRQPPSGE